MTFLLLTFSCFLSLFFPCSSARVSLATPRSALLYYALWRYITTYLLLPMITWLHDRSFWHYLEVHVTRTWADHIIYICPYMAQTRARTHTHKLTIKTCRVGLTYGLQMLLQGCACSCVPLSIWCRNWIGYVVRHCPWVFTSCWRAWQPSWKGSAPCCPDPLTQTLLSSSPTPPPSCVVPREETTPPLSCRCAQSSRRATESCSNLSVNKANLSPISQSCHGEWRLIILVSARVCYLKLEQSTLLSQL